MATRKIKWKTSMAGKIDAEDAYNEIERIRKANGGDISIDKIVAAARNKKNVLHPQIFDKPVPEAAEEYYKSRAQLTLRMLVIEREDNDAFTGETKIIQYRAISVVDEVPQHEIHIYSSTEEAINDPIRRKIILKRAIKQLNAWQKQYSDLVELDDIFQVIRLVNQKYKNQITGQAQQAV